MGRIVIFSMISLAALFAVFAAIYGALQTVMIWIFRSNSSLLDETIPVRFSTTNLRLGTSVHFVGAARLSRSGGSFDVTMGIDEGNVYLVPRPAWTVRFGKPAYVIPRGEILSIEPEVNAQVIHLNGECIRCEDFDGQIFEDRIQDVDVEQLIDTEDLYSMFRRRSRDVTELNEGFDHIRMSSGSLFVLVATALGVKGDWSADLGFVLGGLLVMGALGHALGQLLRRELSTIRFLECSTRWLLTVAVVSVLPVIVSAIVNVVGLRDASHLLQFVAGLSLASALSVAVLTVGLARLRIKCEPSRSRELGRG
jgi:uncharacterized membrane protein